MTTFNFTGQSRIKKRLRNIVLSQRLDGKFPHIGIYGKSGQGKTRIAHELAKAFGDKAALIELNATAIQHPFVLVQEIQKAKSDPSKHYFIFLDESHMLSKKVRESMLSVLETPATLCCAVPRKISGVSSTTGERFTVKAGDIRTFRLPPNISFIFATTERGKIPDTLANRLEDLELDPYTQDELLEISQNVVKKLISKINYDLTIPEFILRELVDISRNIRGLKKYVKSFVALLVDHKRKIATQQDLDEWLDLQDIRDGLTGLDRKYLDVVKACQPVSIQQIASTLSVTKQDLLNKVEPYLLQRGLISITSAGRILTRKVHPDRREEYIIDDT